MKTAEEIQAKLTALFDAGPDDDVPMATELLEWVLAPSPVKHEGPERKRCEYTHDGWLNKEAIFAKAWDKTNHPPSFLNSGRGTLEWLLCSRITESGYQEFYRHLTQAEATAAASAIQWLGTNCGWCWLEECIRDCGFDLVRRRDK